MHKTYQLYAQQAAQGDESGGLSLQYIASFLIAPEYHQQLKQAISDPLVQQLVTIKLFIQSGTLPPEGSDGSGNNGRKIIAPILALLNDAVKEGVEGSDRLAAFAYRSGQYTLADSLLKQAGEGGQAWWLRAKMALRNGDVKAATAAYSEATSAFPADESWGDQRNEDYQSEMIVPDCRISGECAILALNRGDYRQAMELMYRGKEQYWSDVADIAERVLTLDELKTFVDRQVPAPATPLTPRKPGDYYGQQLTDDIRMREILARRLMRAGRYQQAINYFDVPENRIYAQKFTALIIAAGDKTKGNSARARAYYQATTLLRESGLEFTGYEMTPDYAIYGAGYSSLKDVFDPLNQPDKKWVGAGEASRAMTSLPPKITIFCITGGRLRRWPGKRPIYCLRKPGSCPQCCVMRQAGLSPAMQKRAGPCINAISRKVPAMKGMHVLDINVRFLNFHHSSQTSHYGFSRLVK